MTDLIILALSHADAPFSSTIFSLAKEWARNCRVFYIEHPFTLKDYWNRRHEPSIQQRRNALLYGKNIYRSISGAPDNLVVVTPRLTLPINSLPEGNSYEWLSRLNDQILYETIRKITSDYNVQQYIFLNSFDPFYGRYFPASFQPLLYIYQSVDDISQEPYIARHGVRLENEIIAHHADLTLTTSKNLAQAKSQLSPHTHLLPNAADVALFRTALEHPLPKPPELQNRPRQGKVILYTGVISDLRIDYALLNYIARQHTDKTLLLVGPYHTHECRQHGLDQLPNVILAGSKPIDQLPAYLQHADCAIIPFLMNTLTKSIYPLKINEYLAAGKPVVTTPFSDDIVSFGKVVYMTPSPVQFSDYIEQAIYNNNPLVQLERLQTAENNAWTKRAEQFWHIVAPYLDDTTNPLPHKTDKAAAALPLRINL